MPSVVNTNVMSLNAQRQLNKSQLAQNTAMERLSSGLRINSAKDDAAGLAISTGMSSQVRGLNQAVRNANDGISMAQTAEGSMDEMTNILQRMRELSVQAANDTNSSSNRASIQIEIDQLYSEMDRIAETTSFNGINLLDGSNKSTSLHIGSESGQSLAFSIDAVTTKDLNLNAVSGTGELNGGRVNNAAVGAGDITINGSDLGALAGGVDSAATIKTAVNAVTGATGVSAEAYNVVSATAGQSGVTDGSMVIEGTTVAATGSMQELVDTINRDVGGVTAKLDGDGALVLSNDTGNDIAITGAAAGTTFAGTGITADTYNGYVALTAADGESIELGLGTNGTDADLQQMGFVASTGSAALTGAGVSETAITSADNIQINGVDLGAVTGTTAADKAFAINAISNESGVTASATTSVAYEVIVSEAALASAMVINGVSIDFEDVPVASVDDVVTAINTAGIQGVVASTDAETGSLVLTSQAGQDIKITDKGASTGSVFLGTQGSTTVTVSATVTQTTTGKITLTGADGADVIVTSNAALESGKDTAVQKLGFTDVGGNSTAVGTGLSVNSVANANNTINRIDDALDQISDGRANLGAIQNRLSSTISNLANVSQNISAANSRIRDADFAAETSALSKSQVLQQAGTAMLSQANASTQSVLSLLG
jgi:flagellin